MKITKISKIKGYRLFRDFTWPTSLHPFGRFNLIYGWNGTGKTTMAELFRHLQDKDAVTSGEVEFKVDDRSVKGTDISTAQLPPVRVFNREFVAANIFASNSMIAPIYIFGADSVGKKQQVEKLKEELVSAENDQNTAQDKKKVADKTLDDFYIAKAKIIKELLISSRSTNYNNYDKRRFRLAIENLDTTSKQAALLQESEKANFKSQKDAQPKAKLSSVVCEVPEFADFTASTDEILRRSVVSQVIDELVGDRDVGAWVLKGLALHTGERYTEDCRFCSEKVPPTRIATLEGHFNNAFSLFQSEIDILASKVEVHRKRLVEFTPPESSRLYDNLATEFDEAVTTAHALLMHAAAYLGSLHALLIAKRDSPFTPQTRKGEASPDRDTIIQAIGAMNEVIDKHNSTTEQFQSEVDAACQRLEQCYVAEYHDEYIELRDATTAAESALVVAVSTAKVLRDQIRKVELEIVEYIRPVEELNAELQAYLGREELRFEVKDDEVGYRMTRNGEPASNLSEGEKTAIAFLYFLKSLKDSSFDFKDGVVVIDDPVSSLDANSMFSTFSYIQHRTQECGQLFIFTHNYSLLREVKNWFKYLTKEHHHTRCFMLESHKHADGKRISLLNPLDKLLENYDSEYHYLFKRVYAEAKEANSESLEHYYGLPNVARRLLESFIAFRRPEVQGELYKRFKMVEYDGPKKTRILRFLNAYSHANVIPDHSHDLNLLSETPSVLVDVLDFIKFADRDHYDRMVGLVASPETLNSSEVSAIKTNRTGLDSG